MPTEIFTKSQFEAALPKHRDTAAPLWRCLGLIRGEYEYNIDVGNPLAFVRVRSSVNASGLCGDTGEDSIRAWVVDDKGSPIGNKLQRWVTREPEWEQRLLALLRKLAKMAMMVKDCPAPGCCRRLTLVKISKGENKNKVAVTCTAKDKDDRFLNHHFEVIG